MMNCEPGRGFSPARFVVYMMYSAYMRFTAYMDIESLYHTSSLYSGARYMPSPSFVP